MWSWPFGLLAGWTFGPNERIRPTEESGPRPAFGEIDDLAFRSWPTTVSIGLGPKHASARTARAARYIEQTAFRVTSHVFHRPRLRIVPG